MGSLTIKNKVLRCEKCFMLKKVTIEPNYPQTNVSCECCCGIKKDSIVNFLTELQKEEQFKVKCNFCGKEPKHPSYCTGCRRTYCSTCIKSHDTKIATRTPHYVIESYKYDFYCSKHQDELVSAYCMSCYLNICQKCIDEKLHHSHRFVKFSKYLLTREELGKLKITIIVNMDKIDANAKKVDNLIPLLTDQSKIKELKEVCQSSVRDNKAILMLVKFFYKMYKHAKHRNYSMIFNLFENMKFNPLLAPPESTNSIEKRRLDLLDFFKREFAIYRRFAASKRRSKTTVPNMRNVINENIPKDEDQKVNIKIAKIEEDAEERNYTALSKELGFEPQNLQSGLLGDEKTDNDNTENATILKDNAGQEIEENDINDSISKDSSENNDNNVEKDENNKNEDNNKEGNIKIVTLDENSEKKIEAKDEEKKEVNKIKENEDPNKKKEINFKVDDKIKNRLNFINNYNKPEEEKKESKVIDIRKLCAMEIEEQKKNERERELKKEERKVEEQKEEKSEEKKEEEKKEEKIEEKKEPEEREEKKVEIKEEKKEPEKKEEKKVKIIEEKKEVKKEPARIRRISNKTLILHLTGLPIGMPAAPKTPEQIAKEEEEERKRKEEEEKKREEELARKKIEAQDRQKRVKKALLRIKTKKVLQTHESKEPTPSAQPNIITNSKFSDLAKVMGNKILAREPLMRKDGAKEKKPEEKEKEKEKEQEQEEQAQHTDSIHEIIMNKPISNNGSLRKKPTKVGFSDNVNANDIEEVTEEENNDNN